MVNTLSIHGSRFLARSLSTARFNTLQILIFRSSLGLDCQSSANLNSEGATPLSRRGPGRLDNCLKHLTPVYAGVAPWGAFASHAGISG